MPTVLVDNTGQSTGGTSTTSLSISSFAVGSGANRFIDLTVSQYSVTDQVPSATFNGSENFVVHDAATIGEGAGTRRVTKLRLVNPSNATAAIAVSWGGTVNEATIGATSWTGVDQTTPFGTAVKNTSNNASSSTVNVTAPVGDVISDGYSGDGDNPAKTTHNQTQRWRNIAGAFTTEGQSATAAGTGSSVAMTVTTNIGNIVLCHIAVAIQQAASAAVVTAPLLATAIRPVGKGRIGPLAMVMRGLRTPTTPAVTDIGIASSAALPLGGSISVAVAVQASASGALPLGGNVAAAVAVQATTSGALPLGGSIAAAVAVTTTSSLALPLSGAVSAAVSVTASSSQPLPLSGAISTAVAVAATTNQPLPLGGTITAGSGAFASSSQPLPLSGAITTAIGVVASSTLALPLNGQITTTLAVQVSSVQALILGGAISAAIGIQATSVQALPLGGTIVATGPFLTALLDEPLSIAFDSLETALAFDPLDTRLVFLTVNGDEMLELKIIEGEVAVIAATLEGRDPVTKALVPHDLTGATSIKITVRKPDETPIINARDMTAIAPPTSGRVTFTPTPAETAVGGIYKALVKVTYPGSPDPIVRKFPGRVIIEDAIA